MSTQKILELIEFLNGFKHVERLSLIGENGRRESDAEHTWHLVMTLWVLRDSYEKEVDFDKVIKIALVHDLVEIVAGDVYAHSTEVTKEQKRQNELEAMRVIKHKFSESIGSEIEALWLEYEGRVTNEAEFVWLADKLMPRILYNFSKGDSTDKMPSDKIHDQNQKKEMGQRSQLFNDLLLEIYKDKK